MSSSPPPAGQPQPEPRPFPLPLEPRQLVYALFVLTGLFAAIPLGVVIHYKGVQAAVGPVFIWGLALTVLALVAALTYLAYESDPRLAAAEKARLVLICLGGLVGFVTAAFGAVLPFTTFYDQLEKGMEDWRAHPWALILPALAVLGGLGLMFASLQLGRGMERTNQTMRRLIYGYNAVLTGLLLLAVLALPNLLAYAAPFSRWAGKTNDWTKGQVYTLKPDTESYLAQLDTPVQVHVMLDPSDPRAAEMRQFLENCRSITTKINWDLIPSGSRRVSGGQVELQQKYKLPEIYGVLVVLNEGSKEEKWDFIPANDLSNGRPPDADYLFTGERALLNSLRFANEGNAVYYFTQGAGEMSLSSPQAQSPLDRANQPPALGELRRRLTQRKGIEVKELQAQDAHKGVPADAAVVVVAGPKRELSKDMVKALEGYLDRRGEKKGKLLLLLDPVFQQKGAGRELVKTGLEGLLTRNGVKLGNNVICDADMDGPSSAHEVGIVTNLRSGNPIARAFSPFGARLRTLFNFKEMRTVDSAAAGPLAGRGASAEVILMTEREGYWAEEDPNVRPLARLAELDKLLKEGTMPGRIKVAQMIGKKLPVGVAVTGQASGVPGDAAHSALQKPRMVVIGASQWLADDALRGKPQNFDLFENSLSWLRERPAVGKSAPEDKNKPYVIGISTDHRRSLLFLPPVLMLLGVVGVGCGVWVVRRR